jgi:hypothetical protein
MFSPFPGRLRISDMEGDVSAVLIGVWLPLEVPLKVRRDLARFVSDAPEGVSPVPEDPLLMLLTVRRNMRISASPESDSTDGARCIPGIGASKPMFGEEVTRRGRPSLGLRSGSGPREPPTGDPSLLSDSECFPVPGSDRVGSKSASGRGDAPRVGVACRLRGGELRGAG